MLRALPRGSHGLVPRSLPLWPRFSSSSSGPVDVFDRRLKQRQRDWAARLPDSNSFDYLRDEVAQRLADRLLDTKRVFPVTLELGSHSGVLAKHLPAKAGIETLVCAELSHQALTRDIHEDDSLLSSHRPIRVQVDEEFLPFAPESLDLVISNLSLHFVNDLPGTLAQIRQALKPDGLFLATMFGGDSLRELRSSFLLAEQERTGGMSPHISPFAGVQDIGNLLSRAGFALPTVDLDDVQIMYSSPWVLMHELRGMAENNAVRARRFPPVGRDTMLAMASTYQALYGDDGGVPATFEIVNIAAWAPSLSQPKPARRGSATASLQDIS